MLRIRTETLDPTVVNDLLTVADQYKANPDMKVTGAALDALRLLVVQTEQWCTLLTNRLEGPQTLPSNHLPPGVPLTIEAAQALHHRASAAVMDVLKIRREQRIKARETGDGPLFTAADYDAIRLWCRVSAVLNPPSGELQQLLFPDSTPGKPATKPKPYQHPKTRITPSGRQQKMRPATRHLPQVQPSLQPA